MKPTIDKASSDLLTRWTEAAKEATKWQGIEKALREELFAKFFPKATEGTANQKHLPFDKTVVGDHRINYNADKAQVETIMSDKDSNLRPLLEKILTFRPEVRKDEYRALSAEDKLALSDVITLKPGLPGLEIKTTSKMRKKL